RIRLQSRSIRFVRRKTLECDQTPGHIVGPFVRKEVAEEIAAAARDDRPPVLGILPELLFLERIDLIADHAGDSHGKKNATCRAETLRLRSNYECGCRK